MTINASEIVKTHIRWVWDVPENIEQRVVAREVAGALFAMAGDWLDIVALEARVGLYDPNIFTEADLPFQIPWNLLRRDPSGDVQVEPRYRVVESLTSELDLATTIAWIDSQLAEARVSAETYEPSLRELRVAGARVHVPNDLDDEVVTVDCYAGEVQIPVDNGWVTVPATPSGMPSPITLRIDNFDGQLRLVLEVFWSLWASDPDPVAPIRDGLRRLEGRGWRQDE